jgi:hypothetical protein
MCGGRKRKKKGDKFIKEREKALKTEVSPLKNSSS